MAPSVDDDALHLVEGSAPLSCGIRMVNEGPLIGQRWCLRGGRQVGRGAIPPDGRRMARVFLVDYLGAAVLFAPQRRVLAVRPPGSACRQQH